MHEALIKRLDSITSLRCGAGAPPLLAVSDIATVIEAMDIIRDLRAQLSLASLAGARVGLECAADTINEHADRYMLKKAEYNTAKEYDLGRAMRRKEKLFRRASIIVRAITDEALARELEK